MQFPPLCLVDFFFQKLVSAKAMYKKKEEKEKDSKYTYKKGTFTYVIYERSGDRKRKSK